MQKNKPKQNPLRPALVCTVTHNLQHITYNTNHNHFLWIEGIGPLGSCQLIFPLPHPALHFIPNHSRVRSKLSEPMTTFTTSLRPFLSPISVPVSSLPFICINCPLEKLCLFFDPWFIPSIKSRSSINTSWMNKLLSYVHVICVLSTYIKVSIHQKSTPKVIISAWESYDFDFLFLFAHQNFLTVQQWMCIALDNKNNRKKKTSLQHKKGQIYTKEASEVMIHFIEGIFCFVESFVVKIFYVRSSQKKRIWFVGHFRMMKFRKSHFPWGEQKLFLLPSFQIMFCFPLFSR